VAMQGRSQWRGAGEAGAADKIEPGQDKSRVAHQESKGAYAAQQHRRGQRSSAPDF